MKKFDWDIARSRTNPAKLSWLWNNHQKDISLEEYIEEVGKLREYSLGKRKSKRYSPSALKNEYITLRDRFGFFISKNW